MMFFRQTQLRIDTVPSLQQSKRFGHRSFEMAIEFNSIFISHSTSDKPFVEKLKKFLESIGFDVFLDNYEIVGGEEIVERIVNGIYHYDFFGIVLSPRAEDSAWVRRELQIATWRWVQHLKMGRSFIIPILSEDCGFWEGIHDLSYIDFRRVDEFEKRCDDLKRAILKPSSSELFRRQKSFVASPPTVLAYKDNLRAILELDELGYIPRRVLTREQSRIRDCPILS